MLEVNALSVMYGAHLALKEIQLRLLPGTILGVIGPNGAGKSTLIRALSGVLPLHSGSILFDNQDIHAMSAEQRARLMAVVPQAVRVPPAFSALETVLLGRTPYLNWLGQISETDRQAARSAMQRTDTLALAHRPISELSGGEQQRVFLARALAQAAPVLLMDEPTTHLDLKYQVSLLDVVQSLVIHDKLSVLIAMHDLNLVARYAGQVALLVNGEFKAVGTPQQVLVASLLSEAYQIPIEVINSGISRIPIVVPANHSYSSGESQQ